jgi:hypothetical protein
MSQPKASVANFVALIFIPLISYIFHFVSQMHLLPTTMGLTRGFSRSYAPLRIGFVVVLLIHYALAAGTLEFTSFPSSVSIGKTYNVTWQGGDGSVRTRLSYCRRPANKIII